MNTQFIELIRDWKSHPLLVELDVSVTELSPGRALLTLTRNTTNVAGVRNSINGGVQAAVAEIAAHLATSTLLEQGDQIEFTQDLSISYLYSVRATTTLIDAKVLRQGRLTVVDVEILVGDEDEDSGRLNAKVRGTCSLGRRPSKSVVTK